MKKAVRRTRPSSYNRVLFTKEMKKEGWTILAPQMSPIHFDLLAPVFHKHGYRLYATGGTSRYLSDNGIPNTMVHWPSDAGQDPQALDLLHRREIDMVINIPKDLTPRELSNGYKIRRAAIDLNIPLLTNARLASAFIAAFCSVAPSDIPIRSWDEFV